MVPVIYFELMGEEWNNECVLDNRSIIVVFSAFLNVCYF